MKSVLTAVKAKSTAIHCEQQITSAYSVGTQVGQCGHSRKVVPDLVKCLLKCLPSTGFSPHFYMAVVKATVNKRTNEAVVICPTIDGKKVPIVVAAPEVYKQTTVGGVQGGKAEESASRALKQIETKFGSTTLNYLVGKYVTFYGIAEFFSSCVIGMNLYKYVFFKFCFQVYQQMVSTRRMVSNQLSTTTVKICF